MTPTGKRCLGCGKWKALSEFSLDRHNTLDGRQPRCKICEVVVGRANRWARTYGVGEATQRRVLEEVQRETCPLCSGPLRWLERGVTLRSDARSGELYGFTHDRCRQSTCGAQTWHAFITDPPFSKLNDGEPYVVRQPAEQGTLL